jgi:hypothetical protein
LLVGKRRAGESRGHSMFSTPMQWLTRPDTWSTSPNLAPDPAARAQHHPGGDLAGAGQVGSSLAHRLHQRQSCGLHGSGAWRLGLAALPQHLASRDLVPPLNHAALPRLPDVEYVAPAARRLSRPADTLYQILMASRLSRG